MTACSKVSAFPWPYASDASSAYWLALLLVYSWLSLSDLRSQSRSPKAMGKPTLCRLVRPYWSPSPLG